MAGSPTDRGRWAALAVLTVARTAMGFQFQSVGAVSPLLIDRLHISNLDLGWLIGLFSLPGIFFSLPGGLFGTRFGDRRMVLTGLALMAVGSALMGSAGTFATMALGRTVSAVGAILLNVLLTKMLTDWFAGREMIWAMTILINAWPAGIVLALLVLPVVAGAWSLGAVFYVAAAMAALGALGVALAYREPAAAGAPSGTVHLSTLSRRERNLATVASLPWMLYNVGFAVMLGFLPSLLVRGGFSVERAGVLLGLTTFLFIGSVLLGGSAAQWLAREEIVVAVGLLVYGAALAALPYMSPWPMLLTMGLLGGLPAGALAAAPTGVLRPASRGVRLGLFYTLYYVGMALLPPVAGRLQDALGRSAAVYFAAGAILATLPCYLAFRSLASSSEKI